MAKVFTTILYKDKQHHNTIIRQITIIHHCKKIYYNKILHALYYNLQFEGYKNVYKQLHSQHFWTASDTMSV